MNWSIMSLFLISAIFALLFTSASHAGPLHDAVKAGDLVAVDAAISSGSDVNEIDFMAGSALHIAAVRGQANIAKRLLEAGADPNIAEWGNGDTALHWAAMAGKLKVISVLVNAGADIDARNDKQATPLHWAADNRQPKAIRLLTKLGADVRARMKNGQSVVYRAGRSGLFDTVEMLRANGAAMPEPEDVKPYLADADPEHGAELFINTGCIQCHFAPATRGAHPYGPPLWGIVGAKKASQPDYGEYSDAFLRLEGVWNYDDLNRLLTDASEYAPGTYMDNDYDPDNVTLPDVRDRADIIAFLRLQADEPSPLP